MQRDAKYIYLLHMTRRSPARRSLWLIPWIISRDVIEWVMVISGPYYHDGDTLRQPGLWVKGTPLQSFQPIRIAVSAVLGRVTVWAQQLAELSF